MFASLSYVEILGVLVLVGTFAFTVQRIDRRQRELSARIGRLSLTFQKIENDLDAIQSSILILAQNEEDVVEKISAIRDRRDVIFRHIVENGPNSSELLRGIEMPNPKDDPGFWNGDLADRMKLPKSVAEVRGEADQK